tara:strand:+ start:1532 stop:2029 length:498 start_codon:yes stop_codon:yes gene_type:complete
MIKEKYKFFYLFILLIILILYLIFFYFIKDNSQKEKKLSSKTILINLLTSVHPELPWSFKPVKSKITIQPGEVRTIEYIVENLSTETSTGIATFSYYPSEFGDYVSKINCFCYDAQTLKPKEKNKFVLVLLVDPEVTKDAKTKDIKEATMQFIFFDYLKNKEKES